MLRVIFFIVQRSQTWTGHSATTHAPPLKKKIKNKMALLNCCWWHSPPKTPSVRLCTQFSEAP